MKENVDANLYKYALRGGNAGTIQNRQSVGTSSSCPRMILLRDHKIQEPIGERAKITFALGHINETLFADKLKEKGIAFEQEKFVTEELAPNTVHKMAIDFYLPSDNIPFELKACSSTNTYEKVFVQKHAKIENVIQLANYMITLECDEGKLRYTNYLYHKQMGKGKDVLWKAAPDHIVFDVSIDSVGEILVNEVATEVNVDMILEFRYQMAQMLEKQQVYFARQINPDFAIHCNYCYFKEACSGFEENCWGVEEFVGCAKKLVDRGLEIS